MGDWSELDWPEPWYQSLLNFTFSGWGFVSILLIFIAMFLLIIVPKAAAHDR